jgi:hypothetical protein
MLRRRQYFTFATTSVQTVHRDIPASFPPTPSPPPLRSATPLDLHPRSRPPSRALVTSPLPLMPQSRRTYGADYAAAPMKSSIRIRPRMGPAAPSTVRMPRRVIMLVALSVFLGFTFFMMFRSRSSSYSTYLLPASQQEVAVDNEVLLGSATAPKLENATLKYASSFYPLRQTSRAQC